MRNLPFFAAIVIGFAIVAAGYFLLRAKLEQVRTWPIVQAYIVKSSAEERHDEETTRYAVRYVFDYTYAGQPRRAQFFSPATYSQLGAELLVGRHQEGTFVWISVNPANPGQVDPNLGRNPASLAGPLWVMLAGVAIMLMTPPLWLTLTAPEAW